MGFQRFIADHGPHIAAGAMHARALLVMEFFSFMLHETANLLQLDDEDDDDERVFTAVMQGVAGFVAVEDDDADTNPDPFDGWSALTTSAGEASPSPVTGAESESEGEGAPFDVGSLAASLHEVSMALDSEQM
eukprot:14551895-Alexandrium_andersonii.AAC.1